MLALMTTTILSCALCLLAGMVMFHKDTFMPFLSRAGVGRLDPDFPEQALKQKTARKVKTFRRKPQAKTNAKKAKTGRSDQQDKPANAAAVPTPEVEVF